MPGVPISQIVKVTPSVLAPAAGISSLQSMILSNNAALANVRFRTFTGAAAVATVFGATSTEYSMAEVFFSGFTNSTNTPAQLTFAYQSDSGSPASLVGGSLGTMTLSQLQALDGTVVLSINGTAVNFTANLSSATSFANAASLLQTAAASSCVVVYDALNNVFVIQAETDAAAGTITYATGTLASGLALTQGTGAVVVPGLDPASDVSETLSYLQSASHFDAFSHAYAPPAADLTTMAIWNASQANKCMAVLWDNSTAGLTPSNAASFGAEVMAQAYSGVVPVYYDALAAALVLGVMSSLQFTATNGRQTFAFRSNSLVSPTVTSASTATALLGNGYNYYGAFAGAQQSFQFFYDGHIGGTFDWIDSYVCQMWLNQSLTSDLMALLTAIGEIPFNSQGDALIAASLQSTITQAITFGAIRQNVTLSTSEVQAVNNAAGASIASTLQTQGYYLIPGASTAPASVRVARGPVTPQLWYVDGESVQTINLSSVDVL